MDYSILMTCELAPPCLGPESAPAAMAIEVYRSAPELAMCLTNEVEQLMPCYAYIMKSISMAFTNLGCDL